MAPARKFAFLHGGGQGAWVWDETLAALRQQAPSAVQAHTFDLPGCGAKRGVDISRLSVRDVATSFADALAQADMAGCVLVGHSNAGSIMPLVEDLRPGLVQRFIYISCLAPAPDQSIRALMKPRHDFDDTAQDPAARLRRIFCNDMDEPQASRFMARLGHDNWPTLQSLDETGWHYEHLAGIPASYIICLRDQTLPPAWQEDFATRLGAQRRVYIDAGHQVMNTRPHGLAEILRHEAEQP